MKMGEEKAAGVDWPITESIQHCKGNGMSLKRGSDHENKSAQQIIYLNKLGQSEGPRNFKSKKSIRFCEIQDVHGIGLKLYDI